MTVKLASALPKDDKNGLAAIAPALVDRYRSQEHTVAIVVLKTAKITQDEDYQLIPEVKVLRIEPVSGDLEDDARDLLQSATEQRLGKKPDTLDLSGEEGDEFADVAEVMPLELEACVEDAEIVDDDTEPAPVTPLSPLAPTGGDAA